MCASESPGWPIRHIEEVVEVNPRIDKKSIPDDLPVTFVPMSAVGAGTGIIQMEQSRFASEVKKGYTVFRSGDVLFAKITPCMENGKMAVVPPVINGYGFGSTEFHVLRPKSEIDAKYLYFFVSSQSFRKEAERHMTGAVGQRRVPTMYLKECEIPVPSVGQQKRIVAEIEKQFSRLDEGVDNLKRVKANLKRYKAAVLKAAVEGRLVETEAEIARREGRDFETGEQLLQRILQERRRRWEEAELAKMQARGKPPKNDKWKQKYKEPAAPDTTNLPELPEGWVWARLEQLAALVEYGSSAKTSGDRNGVPVLRMGNIVDGDLVYDELKYLPDDHDEFPRLLLEVGDLLFNRTNSPELVGKTAVYEGCPETCSFASYLIRVRLLGGVLSKFISSYINSLYGRNWVKSVVTQQVGQANVNGTKLKALIVPLPPLAEQHRIVTEVDRRLSILRETEAQVKANLQRAERLRQSILAAAFSGRLVSDDTLHPAA